MLQELTENDEIDDETIEAQITLLKKMLEGIMSER
jgi:hypothetical protein